MLKLKNITKSYTTGKFTQEVLKNVSLDFRQSEFVAIFGQSGSGKTTMLNIIGGLDRYDSGDLIINGKSTKNFKNVEWDAYRNNSIGFIFQSYNLIGHISVLKNVELGMTLSGVSGHKRKKKALEVLDRVGLRDHAKKKPNQLSGGQMQRVAIARALANNPDIILADEPTGALDSQTSIQIMDLIKEISNDKLIIMVTHNSELAKRYSNRTIELKDGEVINDSNPIRSDEGDDHKYNLKKTSMSFFTALKLSFNNIMTKKGRTILTAFASSIGIIGIAIILALSNGFDKKIDEFEVNTLSEYPIIISQQAMQVNENTFANMRKNLKENIGSSSSNGEFPQVQEIYPYDAEEETVLHSNKLTTEYAQYVENIDPGLVSGISYTHAVNFNLMTKVDGKVKMIKNKDINLTELPRSLDGNKNSILKNNYDIIAGKYPESKSDILLVVDRENRVENGILESLGISVEGKDAISFDNLLGLKIKAVFNDDYYKEYGQYFTANMDLESLYDNGKAQTLKICGIIRIKKDSYLEILKEGIAYTPEFADYIIEKESASKIVLKQQDVSYNVLTGEQIDVSTEEGQTAKEKLLSYLGAGGIPNMIMIYPRDFDTKEKVLEYLDNWNHNKDNSNMILYTDLADIITTMSGNIMGAITIVLIAFSAISLLVSVIMIGIITYISVLERTKEIGVLRALGARKKDITRVFNAETFIVGLFSGGLGILTASILVLPVNIIIKSLTDLPNVAIINPWHAIILVVISLTLTVIGGFIPAKMAAKKDPVVALRTE